MKFIKLSGTDGTIGTINLEKIEAFYRSSSDTTEVIISSGKILCVKESPEEIEAIITCMRI